MNKVCTSCKLEFPATTEYFHKKNTAIDGLNTRCKDCFNSYYKKYYKENHETVKKKKVEQSRDYYNSKKAEINKRRRKQYKEGTSAKKKYMDEYYQLNRNEIIQKRKDYLSTDEGWAKKVAYDQLRRTREKELPSNFLALDWKRCKTFFDNKCCYCGEKRKLTREHFIPLVNGGEYTINNIIPSCKPCNSSKKTSDFYEWYPKQKFYSKKREQKILSYLNYSENRTQQLALL